MSEHPVQPYLTRTRWGWWWEVATFGLPRFKPYMCGWNRSQQKAEANLDYWLPTLRDQFDGEKAGDE